MRLILTTLILIFSLAAFAVQNTNGVEKFNKNNKQLCVQAFLNKEKLKPDSYLAKNTQGIITVSKDNKSNVYFNITLKSNIGKKGEPPIYLRFIKQKQLNISELLEYASEGDEIYIEEYISSLGKANVNCPATSITVVEN
ncbi:MAG TPA: hypothetical protein PKM51_03145 [Chitinophagales bacterium]|nr:hypothetical protein [Chitinophagales bacterium]HNM31723.1 hypothetical protein [Chitinophagales bacterium]